MSLSIHMVSDLHGYAPSLLGGDLLLIGGDHTRRDAVQHHRDWVDWINRIAEEYKKIVYIAGNHDMWLESQAPQGYGRILTRHSHVEYLCDAATTWQGLSIYGCPYSKSFANSNIFCRAFAHTEFELEQLYQNIPYNIDILLTHEPPHGILDTNTRGEHCGSHALRRRVEEVKPKIHVFGHIHECGGQDVIIDGVHYYNASLCDERYQRRKDFPFFN